MNLMLKLTDVKKTYQSGTIRVEALKGINMDVKENEFVAIMGHSGSGKSTLLNILGCLDSLTEGSYILDGTEVAKLSENQLADIRNKKIGFVFQTFNLLSKYTAVQNVELPMIYAGFTPHKRKQLALEALDRVGLKDRALHRPAELSGGERQRVAIARALVNNPALLLADEPTGNLDSQRGNEIMEIITKLHKEGMTIVLVTHENDIAAYAGRLIQIFDGLVVKH